MDNGPQRRTLRTTPALVKNLRTLKVAVLHPDDADGRQLIQQLQRIGCQVQAFWPPLPALPEGTDAVFLAVRPDSIDMGFDWLKSESGPTVIAVTTYENPTIVEAVLHVGAKAVLPSPVRSVGLLSSLVVARQIHDDLKAQAKRLQKLESKLLGARRIEEAKGILMRTRQISEAAAYDLIREQAMSKRVTTEDIAAAIVNANEVLSLGQPPSP
jgi:AmiR/NasT family two-component response regulator